MSDFILLFYSIWTQISFHLELTIFSSPHLFSCLRSTASYALQQKSTSIELRRHEGKVHFFKSLHRNYRSAIFFDIHQYHVQFFFSCFSNNKWNMGPFEIPINCIICIMEIQIDWFAKSELFFNGMDQKEYMEIIRYAPVLECGKVYYQKYITNDTIAGLCVALLFFLLFLRFSFPF